MAKEALSQFDEALIKGALRRVGLENPGLATIAVSASGLTDLSADQLWKAWSDIESWPRWSKPLHSSARWLEKRDWEVGARFEQTLNFGFPIGRIVSLETVKEVNQHQSVSWWKHEKGVKSCQIWAFLPMPDGKTRVSKAAIFTGFQFFLSKPFVTGRLRDQFQQSVNGLIHTAERNS